MNKIFSAGLLALSFVTAQASQAQAASWLCRNFPQYCATDSQPGAPQNAPGADPKSGGAQDGSRSDEAPMTRGIGSPPAPASQPAPAPAPAPKPEQPKK